jgi:uncharacterized protein YecE (DUF72 family)
MSSPLVYVGCAKWGRKEWVGKLYPEGTKEVNFLNHYVNHFNSIELNATHYQIYGPSTIGKWAMKAAGKDFKFCPKVPQAISHYSNLITPQVQRLTDEFLAGVEAFKENLGPIFLQLSEKFSPSKKENLFGFLKSLPTDIQFFVEVRHPDWYSDTKIAESFFTTLRNLNIGAVITDAAGRRDCVHMKLPVAKTFIRYEGNNLHETDYHRLDDWVNHINSWIKNGLKEVYFFMHSPDETYSPALCDYFIQRINKKCKLALHRPVFLEEGVSKS